MSKVLGIIAEYNPFHNGHLYHLEESKKITNCDSTIAVISGNFTQRGSSSIIDKWKKTELALKNGVDLIIELPTIYSISSSENFANGSTKILNSLGIVDYLSFGSECDNLEVLEKISNVLVNEPEEFKKHFNKEIKKGNSFPKARETALNKYLNDDFSNILSEPNNILAIEYLKALKQNDSNIKPISISRTGSSYNSTEINNSFASATAIRNLVKNNNFDKIKNVVPESTYSLLFNEYQNNNTIPDINCFEKEIFYILRKMSIEEISNLPDVSEGLEFSIKNSVNSCNTLIELLNNLKSKRYTYTRLQRILLYALLGITKEDMEISKNTIPYIHVLGFNDKGEKLLSEIKKKNPDIKLITSVKKFEDLNSNPDLKRLLDIDIFSTNIYCSAKSDCYVGNQDYKNKIVKI